jgi:hypothetical protein
VYFYTTFLEDIFTTNEPTCVKPISSVLTTNMHILNLIRRLNETNAASFDLRIHESKDNINVDVYRNPTSTDVVTNNVSKYRRLIGLHTPTAAVPGNTRQKQADFQTSCK